MHFGRLAEYQWDGVWLFTMGSSLLASISLWRRAVEILFLLDTGTFTNIYRDVHVHCRYDSTVLLKNYFVCNNFQRGICIGNGIYISWHSM